jgi:hypothetical protein
MKKRKRRSKGMTFAIGIMLLPWTINMNEVTTANKYGHNLTYFVM